MFFKTLDISPQPVSTLAHQYLLYSESSLLSHFVVERVGVIKLIIQDLIVLMLGFLPFFLDCSLPRLVFSPEDELASFQDLHLQAKQCLHDL